MLANRSMPNSTVIPELAYLDVEEAIEWLCEAFGFTLRLRIGEHRGQLNIGDGAMVLTERRGRPGVRSDLAQSVMVRVEDVAAHHARAAEYGARILAPPADHPYGERQYSVEDLGGHAWTFSQSLADVDPASWGAEPGEL
jgi:uncharacterized glyoxalase superfamily protein PhnB